MWSVYRVVKMLRISHAHWAMWLVTLKTLPHLAQRCSSQVVLTSRTGHSQRARLDFELCTPLTRLGMYECALSSSSIWGCELKLFPGWRLASS